LRVILGGGREPGVGAYERPATFDEEHREPAFGEGCRGGEAGGSAADHERFRLEHSSVRMGGE
jgi:hypothetical protein